MAGSDLTTVMAIAGSGLRAQSQRMKVVAENIANAQTTPSKPGEMPYQRKVVSFKSEFDRALGVYKVKVDGVRADKSEFIKKFDPSNPAADEKGYVLTPNVKPLLEGMDMRQAQHSYNANLSVIESSRSMLLKTIDLLRN
ncbi:MAG: flagellar basal body rod protein FlgC [Alphaproteobacteria bacterium]|jgi:flagellar basal-body rod protein FlgC|nr:flagellar basal body rod protein FlgC [Alphaproteobacteria bacterium]